MKRQKYEDSEKISSCESLGWGKDETEFLGQWNYSLCYYNGGYMLLYICQNPLNVNKSESWCKLWTLGHKDVLR